MNPTDEEVFKKLVFKEPVKSVVTSRGCKCDTASNQKKSFGFQSNDRAPEVFIFLHLT